MASNLIAMASNLEAMASNLIVIASNLEAMASNLIAMASNLEAMVSNLIAMASNLEAMGWRPLLLGVGGWRPLRSDSSRTDTTLELSVALSHCYPGALWLPAQALNDLSHTVLPMLRPELLQVL